MHRDWLRRGRLWGGALEVMDWARGAGQQQPAFSRDHGICKQLMGRVCVGLGGTRRVLRHSATPLLRGVLHGNAPLLPHQVKPGAAAMSLTKGMRVRPDGPQLISAMVRRYLGIECCVLMGANIATVGGGWGWEQSTSNARWW